MVLRVRSAHHSRSKFRQTLGPVLTTENSPLMGSADNVGVLVFFSLLNLTCSIPKEKCTLLNDALGLGARLHSPCGMTVSTKCLLTVCRILCLPVLWLMHGIALFFCSFFVVFMPMAKV